ncbi:Enolase [Trichinella pseudospiralis]
MKKKANGGKFTLADLIEELKSPPNEQTVSAAEPFDNDKNIKLSKEVTKDLQELNLKLCELLKKQKESD